MYLSKNDGYADGNQSGYNLAPLLPPHNPQSHTGPRTAGRRCVTAGRSFKCTGVVWDIAGIVGGVKGWLTSSIAKYKRAFASAGPRAHAGWLPMATSNEKGISLLNPGHLDAESMISGQPQQGNDI